ncbi:type VI secretion system baseplate subunit TssF/IglH, partial [Piscirickettsia litoralis]|uniref:type VI secretion system baseplate subunit TssF/IglH n=1 Tax=Piscirickettsia litoralis TaxID=1891921 RepID=UPI00130159E8
MLNSTQKKQTHQKKEQLTRWVKRISRDNKVNSEFEPLLHAVASFSQKIEESAHKQLQQLRQQQLMRYFPFFLKPTFSKCIAQIKNQHHFAEAMPIYRHESIKGITNNQNLIFKPLGSWHIYPLVLESSQIDAIRGILSLNIKLNSPIVYRWHTLPLYLHVSHQVESAFLLRHQLIRALNSKAEFISQGKVVATEKIKIKKLSFGKNHPIEQIKDFLNFPELNNFINIHFEELPLDAIDNINLKIKIDKNIINDLELNNLIYANVLPFTNISSEHALPIDVQGFQEAYPIIHPDIHGKFQLANIKKAYYKENGETINLFPSHLAETGAASYELIQHFSESNYSELRFHFPENISKSRTIFIDADWFQLDYFRQSELNLTFYNRSENHLKVNLLNSQPTTHLNEQLKVENLIELANIKNQRIIKHDDIAL